MEGLFMQYNKAKYIGKAIQIYPGDSYSKFGIIIDVDDLGWTIKVTKSLDKLGTFEEGKEYFISHSKPFTFKFM
jgi:hypothetical protein